MTQVFINGVLLFLFFVSSVFSFIENNDKLISLDFSIKTVENKKLLKTEGTVYYNFNNNQMVTYMKKPFETITFLNSLGEVKVYDFESNTLFQYSSAFSNTETSYFYYFFNGNYHDFDLAKNGYIIKENHIEDGALVSTWIPGLKSTSSTNKKIIIASEKNLPIYIEFLKDNKTTGGKIYFSEYQKIMGYSIPMKIVEIYYKTKKDSVVTIKKYFNPKFGKDVSTEYINFKVPANAKKIRKE